MKEEIKELIDKIDDRKSLRIIYGFLRGFLRK